MEKIKINGIVKGGLLAGLVINIGGIISSEIILKEQWDAALDSLNREPISGMSGLWLILMGFVMGGIMMWIYAAIQPRFGKGYMAAISVGLITWLLVYVLALGWSVAMEVYPFELYIWTLVWSFFETLLASLSGSWLYKK